jgi:putative acetyltransferase
VAAGFEIREAAHAADVAACRALFEEYQRALGVSLCFQGFDRELASLPGDYAPPRGTLLIALDAAGEPAGCAALRPLGPGEAEMKRLYVCPAHRGRELGRALAERVIASAARLGYSTLRLDTLPSMHAAQRLYAEIGFVETAPYNDNPIEGTRFLALQVARPAPV